MTAAQDKIFVDRINRHPELRERMEALLNIVENAEGDCTKANDAEQRVIEEVRKIGNTALHGWANQAVERSAAQLRKDEKSLEGNGKKKSGGIPPLER